MRAAGLTALICGLWLVQGLGFVQWLLPDVRRQTVAGWIAAMWLGLLLSLVVIVNLYMLLPVTIGQIAWPVTVALSIGSAVAYLKSARPRLDLDVLAYVVLVVTVCATLLLLRPLLSESSLGFYFSNNGEFSNYAAISDAVQFHRSSEPIAGLGMHSREAVLGTLGAVVSTLTGKSALWIIQPLCAAFAALAIASLGLLVRRIVRAYELALAPAAVVMSLYLWATLSASAQCFWTLSFASQYLSIALFFGGLAVLAETDAASPRIRCGLLALLVAGLLVAYPEMILPSAGLLATFEVARVDGRRERMRTTLRVVAALVAGLVLANRLGIELMSRGGAIGTSGWNIYGPHDPILGFVSSVAGFTNPFSGPATRWLGWPALASLLFASSALFAIVRVRKESIATSRALMHLAWMFCAALAVLCWLVHRRGNGNNYVALKLILSFGWLVFLVTAIAMAQLFRWRPRLWPLGAVVLLVLLAALAKPAVEFSKNLHRAKKQALFTEDEARRCRPALGTHPYISSTWFNYAIIGYFIAYDHDVYSANHVWPDGSGQHFSVGDPVVLVGRGHTPRGDPAVSGPYLPACSGRHFSVLRAAPAHRL